MAAESEKVTTPFCIALSGGSTPELLYSVLGDHFSKSVNWENIHFFWGDERCVPAGSHESNFGMTHRSLLGKINIPASNIHRIRGEDDPAMEASRYAGEISDYTRKRDGLPVFDLIILGLGEDGHTASIFPSEANLMESEKICEVASHPVSMQKRITLTGRIINNADKVTFLVTGRKKAVIVEKIIGYDVIGYRIKKACHIICDEYYYPGIRDSGLFFSWGTPLPCHRSSYNKCNHQLHGCKCRDY